MPEKSKWDDYIDRVYGDFSFEDSVAEFDNFVSTGAIYEGNPEGGRADSGFKKYDYQGYRGINSATFISNLYISYNPDSVADFLSTIGLEGVVSERDMIDLMMENEYGRPQSAPNIYLAQYLSDNLPQNFPIEKKKFLSVLLRPSGYENDETKVVEVSKEFYENSISVLEEFKNFESFNPKNPIKFSGLLDRYAKLEHKTYMEKGHTSWGGFVQYIQDSYGLSNKDTASLFFVTEQTVKNWKNGKEEFGRIHKNDHVLSIINKLKLEEVAQKNFWLVARGDPSISEDSLLIQTKKELAGDFNPGEHPSRALIKKLFDRSGLTYEEAKRKGGIAGIQNAHIGVGPTNKPWEYAELLVSNKESIKDAAMVIAGYKDGWRSIEKIHEQFVKNEITSGEFFNEVKVRNRNENSPDAVIKMKSLAKKYGEKASFSKRILDSFIAGEPLKKRFQAEILADYLGYKDDSKIRLQFINKSMGLPLDKISPEENAKVILEEFKSGMATHVETMKKLVDNAAIDISPTEAKLNYFGIHNNTKKVGLMPKDILESLSPMLLIPEKSKELFIRSFDNADYKKILKTYDWEGHYQSVKAVSKLTYTEIKTGVNKLVGKEKSVTVQDVLGWDLKPPKDELLLALVSLVSQKFELMDIPFNSDNFTKIAKKRTEEIDKEIDKDFRKSEKILSRFKKYQKKYYKITGHYGPEKLNQASENEFMDYLPPFESNKESIAPEDQVYENDIAIATWIKSSREHFNHVEELAPEGTSWRMKSTYAEAVSKKLKSYTSDIDARDLIDSLGKDYLAKERFDVIIEIGKKLCPENESMARNVSLILLGIPEDRSPADMLDKIREGYNLTYGDILREHRLKKGIAHGNYYSIEDLAWEFNNQIDGKEIDRSTLNSWENNKTHPNSLDKAQMLANEIGFRQGRDRIDYISLSRGLHIDKNRGIDEVMNHSNNIR